MQEHTPLVEHGGGWCSYGKCEYVGADVDVVADMIRTEVEDVDEVAHDFLTTLEKSSEDK